MEYQTLNIEIRQKVAQIKLIRQDKLNPLDIIGGKELKQALKEIGKDAGVNAVIIIGSGKAFSAGGDVKGMLKSIEEGHPDRFMDELTQELYAIALQLRMLPKPAIAAVNGYAVGAGMNLALACDFIIASTNALFSQTFCRLGLIPGFGGTYFLANQLPWQKAAEIAFLGDHLTAQQMQDYGFVYQIVPNDDLETAAWELADRLAKGATGSFARTKMLFINACQNGFQQHLEFERKHQVESTLTAEYETGVKALLKI